MNIISNQYLREEKRGSAVYILEIRNFLRKLRQCRIGSKESSEMFYVNLSRFSIDLYIAGDRVEDHLSIFLTHHSDWMVRARADVSVKHEVLRSTVKAGTVFHPQNTGLSERSLGWSNCVPHSRCTTDDLLSPNGSLILEVKVVEIMANNGADNGPIQKELEELRKNLLLQEKVTVELRNDLNKLSDLKQKLDKEEKLSAGLKHKLASQEMELGLVKTKLQKLETEEQPSGQTVVVAAQTIQCPMCSEDVTKPMRLQQCLNVSFISLTCSSLSYICYLQGHIICEGCYHHLGTTSSKDPLCIACNSNYIGRPRALEQILELVESNIVIDD